MKDHSQPSHPSGYYKDVISRIEQAYILVEVLFDEKNEPFNYYYIEANAAANKIAGKELVGKRATDVNSAYYHRWIKILGRVAKTGQPETHEMEALPLGAYYRFQAIKVGLREERKIAVIYEDITDRKLADLALRNSEQKYRTLFNFIDEGFCIFELIYDDGGQAIDWIYTEANPAFERQTGYINPIGKKISYFQPDLENSWFSQFAEVARTAKPIRFTQYSEAMDIWYDVYAMPVDPPGGDRVSLLFSDVTDRKLLQERQAFLLKLSDVLRPLTSPNEIRSVAMKLMGAHLKVSRSAYVDAEIGQDTMRIISDYTDGVAPWVGSINLADFGAALGKDFAEGKTVIIDNILTDERFTDSRDTYLRLEIAAAVGVPLFKNGKIVAAMGVHNKAPRKWKPDEIKIIEETAERIWAAVERARAEQTLNETEQRLQVIFEALPVGIGFSDKQGYYHLINKAMRRYLPDNQMPSVSSLRHRWSAWDERGNPLPITQYPGARGLRGDTVVPGTEMLYKDENGKDVWTIVSSVPMRNEAGEIIGQLGVIYDVNELKRAQHDLQNVKAEEQLRRLREEQQQEIFRVILRTQDEERRRIAESLHNGLGQLLYGIKISLSHLSAKNAVSDPAKYEKDIRYTDKLLTDAIRDSRAISHELMPTILDEFGLQAAIKDACEQMRGSVRFHCSFKPNRITADKFMELAIFRIVQELMINVVKHADAKEANVMIAKGDGQIVIKVKDDGRGIDLSKQRRDGIGLTSIKSKIELLNGQMDIFSSDGNGTEVILRWPYRSAVEQ